MRTKRNVRESDGTLILNMGALDGGTALTQRVAERVGKPCLVIALDRDPGLDEVFDFIEEHAILVLNIAGPRESGRPGIGEWAEEYLRLLLGCIASEL